MPGAPAHLQQVRAVPFSGDCRPTLVRRGVMACGRCDGHGAAGLAAMPCGPVSATDKSLRLLATLFPGQGGEWLEQWVSKGPSHSGFDANLLIDQLTHFGNFQEAFLGDSRKIGILVKGVPDAHLREHGLQVIGGRSGKLRDEHLYPPGRRERQR